MIYDFEKDFLPKAIVRANLHFYKYEDAIDLVHACKKNKKPILGIDSFLVTATKTQPFSEHSIDLSESFNCYEEALSFLQTKKEYSFVYEIVF